MVAGTSSSAGKSVVTAAICRVLAKRGYDVAPFKAQNMSLNSYITSDGKEIAIAQAYQAFAAGVEPDARMNPILLKPKGEGVSQLVIMGEAVGDVDIFEYWKMLDEIKKIVRRAFEELANEFEIIVIEGAGGVAEINLYDRDVANIYMARLAKPNMVVVGDIDRGGVFASLYGSYALLPEDVRKLVKGFVINRLRGRSDVLAEGISKLEEMTGVKVLGVLPHLEFPLPSEDSLNVEEWKDCGRVAILRLPRMSNYTDFEPIRGVCCFAKGSLEGYDVVIVPGSKDTVADLKFVKQKWGDELKKVAGRKPIIGICGGYQMLGRELIDYGVESCRGRFKGLGLLDAVTEFREFRKTTRQVRKRVVADAAIIGKLRGEYVWGYEIHKGVTRSERRLFEDEGCVSEDGMTWGTYLHGLFWNRNLVDALSEYLGVKIEVVEDWAEALADAFERHVSIDPLLS